METVDGQCEIGVFAMNAHIVPSQIIEPQSAWSCHLSFASSQINAHLQGGRLKYNQTVVGPAGCQKKQRVRPGCPEPETEIRRRAGLLQRQGDVARTVKRGCPIESIELGNEHKKERYRTYYNCIRRRPVNSYIQSVGNEKQLYRLIAR